MIRVGVTGHRRPPKLPNEARDAVTATVGAVLDRIVEAGRAVGGRHAEAFDTGSGTARLEAVVVSSLAAGADQLVAEAAAARDFLLDVVLPFPRDVYRTDFDTKRAREAYDRLLGRARACFELDGTREGPERAYEAAGLVMLSNVDILIAIWNEAEAGGRGGTALVVEQAIASQVPVVLINPAEPTSAKLLWNGSSPLAPTSVRIEDLPEAEALEALGEVVPLILAPPVEAEAAPLGLSDYLCEPERRRRGWLPRIYPGLLWLFGVRRFAAEDRLGEAYLSRLDRDWQSFAASCPGQARDLQSALRTTLLPAYAFADRLGLYYSHLYRGAFVASFLLAALAVVVALFGVFGFASHHVPVKALLVALEVVLIAGIFRLFLDGRKGRWHEKWLAYRQLAELLRPMRLLAFVGAWGPLGRPVATPPHQGAATPAAPHGADFAFWYARALRRALPLPNARVDRDYLLSVRGAAAQASAAGAGAGSELEGQIAYHTLNAMRMQKMENRLHLAGNCLFFLTILVCGLFLASFLALAAISLVEHGDLRPFEEPGLLASYFSHLKPWTTFLAAMLPTLGAALLAIRVQADFETIAHRSHHTSESLRAIRAAMLSERLSFALLSDRIGKAVSVMTSDLDEWHVLFRARPLALPA